MLKLKGQGDDIWKKLQYHIEAARTVLGQDHSLELDFPHDIKLDGWEAHIWNKKTTREGQK